MRRALSALLSNQAVLFARDAQYGPARHKGVEALAFGARGRYALRAAGAVVCPRAAAAFSRLQARRRTARQDAARPATQARRRDVEEVQAEPHGMEQDAHVERVKEGVLGAARVVSLDVFDTMLTRACGSPEALYLWLGRRLCRQGLLSCTPEVFARIRQRAERMVWEREGGLDSGVLLRDFYAEVARMLRLDAGRAETLMQEELALEASVLCPTGQGRALLAAAERAGAQVVFTSDTYFPEAFIKSQLMAHGLWPDGARCFASCEHRKSKVSGALFELIKDEMKVAPGCIIHLGDHPQADIKAACRAGLRAEALTEGRLNRFEQMLVDARWDTEGMSAAMAGASREVRMHIPVATAQARTIRDVAAGVAGPFLTAYVLWILYRARELTIERLFFVARDGQVLAELAGILATRLGMDIDIRYLYASRRSVNLAAVYVSDPVGIEWVFREAVGSELGDLLSMMDLDVAEVADELASLGLAECTASTRVNTRMVERLVSGMAAGALWQKVLEKARARREIVLGYLAQEGLMDGVRCGIVDLGGAGSHLRSLHALCVRNEQPPPRLFVIGLETYLNPDHRTAVSESAWLDDTECYLYDLPRRRGMRPFRGLRAAFQMFCATDHGTVLGYRQSDEAIHPVTKSEGSHQAICDWGLPLFRQTVRTFAQRLVIEHDWVDPAGSVSPVICAVVEEFKKHPTHDEALGWGAFPFESGASGSADPRPIARPYTWRRLLGAAKSGSLGQGGWNRWHEADVALSSPVIRVLLRGAERLYRAIKESNVRSLEPVRRRLTGKNWLQE